MPFRVTRTSIRYSDLSGAPYQPLDPEVHHRNETLAGFGDPWLLGRWGRSCRGTALTARAGVTLPSGHTEEDPFALGRAGAAAPAHPVRQRHLRSAAHAGPLAHASAGRPERLRPGAADALRERQGLPGGQSLLRRASRPARWWPPRSPPRLVSTSSSERPERWAGEIQQDGNLGRTELLGGLVAHPALRVAPSPA